MYKISKKKITKSACLTIITSEIAWVFLTKKRQWYPAVIWNRDLLRISPIANSLNRRGSSQLSPFLTFLIDYLKFWRLDSGTRVQRPKNAYIETFPETVIFDSENLTMDWKSATAKTLQLPQLSCTIDKKNVCRKASSYSSMIKLTGGWKKLVFRDCFVNPRISRRA